MFTLNEAKTKNGLGKAIILASEIVHIIVFFAASILTFFIFYETVLIPLILLIAQGGSGGGRLRAGILFFVYTLGGSAPMLTACLYLISNQGEILNQGAEVITSLSLFTGEITAL